MPSLAAAAPHGGKAKRGRPSRSCRTALASANWLVNALDQRARTIVKVATELVKQQEAFFQPGVEHLKPLTLRAIAEAIGMHESTVSRVTSNKYLQCERGLFELKYFFTSGIAVDRRRRRGVGAGGQGPHRPADRRRDRRPRRCRDDKLVDLLQAEGFDIARRTVAKYREAMGLGSSVARRRAKLLEAAA